jgi:hypothetical protein
MLDLTFDSIVKVTPQKKLTVANYFFLDLSVSHQ